MLKTEIVCGFAKSTGMDDYDSVQEGRTGRVYRFDSKQLND